MPKTIISKGDASNTTINGFSYNRAHDGTHYTFKKNTQEESRLKIIKIALDPDMLIYLNQTPTHNPDLPPIHLVNTWFCMTYQSDGRQQISHYYSKEHQLHTIQAMDSGFPLNELLQDPHFKLLTGPFYKELYFNYLLEKNGTSIEKLRAMKEMTQGKIELIYRHYKLCEKLLAKGFTMQDIAQIKEQRLTAIFSNFEAFEEASTVFNIRDVTSINSDVGLWLNPAGFFNKESKNSGVVNNNTNKAQDHFIRSAL